MLRLYQQLDKMEVKYYVNTVSMITERYIHMYRGLVYHTFLL
jgi:hypothetical protein